jgi:hypothetical protein
VTHAGADRRDAYEQGIRVAINPNVAHLQNMPAGFAFFPKLVSRPRKENHFAAALRQLKRLIVHKSQHQYFARGLVLNDCGDQPTRFVERDFHDANSFVKNQPQKQKTRWACCASGLKSVLSSESLSTPQRARRMAVMMMVAVDVVSQNHGRQE